jgi:hypothetical protein
VASGLLDEVASLKFECVQAVGGVGRVDELKGIFKFRYLLTVAKWPSAT